jgi:hypothetical protein
MKIWTPKIKSLDFFSLVEFALRAREICNARLAKLQCAPQRTHPFARTATRQLPKQQQRFRIGTTSVKLLVLGQVTRGASYISSVTHALREVTSP